jgi:hypothetical protein
MSQQAGTIPAQETDGRHDFDFLFGRWEIANCRLENPLDEHSNMWSEFEATAEAGPILGGLGNYDTYSAPKFPGRPGFRGFGLRLFDPETELWRIWWASTIGHGQLDTPLVGRFQGGEGRFECDDVLEGRALKVRFDWKDITQSSSRWEQAFSLGEGTSFITNWIMDWTRVA